MSAPWTLDLLRHGAAEPSSTRGDRARALSERGRADLGRLAAALAAAGARYDRVFASPLRRAHESAMLALGGRPGARVETLEALLPDHEPDVVLEALEALGAAAGHVLLVGHQPQLGLLTARLTGGETRFAPATLVRLRVAGTARAVRGPVAQVEWSWSPDAAPGT